jgi:hypothetical protein
MFAFAPVADAHGSTSANSEADLSDDQADEQPETKPFKRMDSVSTSEKKL